MNIYVTWVESVAGSGKTSFIASSVVSCAKSGAPILCLGFSRTSIRKMYSATLTALQNTHSHEHHHNIHFSTLHSLATELIGDSACCTEYTKQLTLDLVCEEYYNRYFTKNQNNLCDELTQPSSSEINETLDVIKQFEPIIGIDAHKYVHDVASLLSEKLCIYSYKQILHKALDWLGIHTMKNPPRYIFVDEAQDLSASQWELLERVAQEGLSWYGAVDLYIVGDPNQIVYQFQGSSRTLWDAWMVRLPGKLTRLTHCYRCSAPIIQLVNRLFMPRHSRENKPGWVVCTDQYSVDQISQGIKQICAQGAQYEDILILVRRRGVYLQRLLDSLGQHAIPVSGLAITIDSHIELIKPFINAINTQVPSEHNLMKVLYALYPADKVTNSLMKRDGSVRDMLEREYPEVLEFLSGLSRYDCGKFLYQLSTKIDIHPEIFNLAASCPLQHTNGFVEYCKQNRWIDCEPIAGCVRVLTIHGAKGLQAKYVIIADGTEAPKKRTGFFRYKSELYLPTLENAEKRARATIEEEDNLLYVALTRAEVGLLVCGMGKAGKRSFVERVSEALKELGCVDGRLGSGCF